MKPRRTHYLRAAALATCVGAALALLGPFGSYLNGPFSQRLLFWLPTCWAGMTLYGLTIRAIVGRWGMMRTGWIAIVTGVLLASAVEAWISRSLALFLWPQLEPRLPELPLWYVQTVLLGGILTAMVAAWSLHRQREDGAREAREGAAPETSPEPFIHPGTIVALQIEDHYVRIHRAEGSDMVLMPLKRAIEAMEGISGLQTHRSWWVARSAVTEVLGSPRSMQLRLTNGLEVPVARSAVIVLREAGWLPA